MSTSFSNDTLIKNINKSLKIVLSKNINLLFSPDKTLISLTPIFPVKDLNNLLKLYNLEKLNISKEIIANKIKLFLTKENNTEIKIPKIKRFKFKQNGIDIEKKGNEIKITDNNFIKDCIILSKGNNIDNIINIANKISTLLFGKFINFEYVNKEQKNSEEKYYC